MYCSMDQDAPPTSDELIDRRPSVTFKIPTSSSDGDLSILSGDHSDFDEIIRRTFSSKADVMGVKEMTCSAAGDHYNGRQDSLQSTSSDISFALSLDNVLSGLSIVYAFVMSIVGLIIPISEALNDTWLDTIYGAAFLTYQLAIGCLFLLYLQFHHVFKRQWFPFFNLQGDDSADNSSNNNVSRNKGASTNRRPSIGGSTIWVDMTSFGDIFTHPETSLFLRVGTLVFSFGNLIYYGFEIASYMNLDDDCKSKYKFGWTFYLRFAFILLQTYFLFKSTGVSLSKRIYGVWFGMLHLVSTNICLWFRTVIHEIWEEVVIYQNSKQQHDNDDNNSNTYGATNTTRQKDYDSNHSKSDCTDELLHNISLYLFPFILEYSLIAVGSITSLLHSMVVSKNDQGHRIQDVRNNFRVVSLKKRNAASDDEAEAQHQFSYSSSSSHSGDMNILGKAHRGFFLAALVVAGIIAAIILFYLMPQKKYDGCLPSIIYHATDLCLHVFLLCGCVLGFIQMMPLGFVPKTTSTDDVLIVIAMCGSVMYDVAAIIASSDSLVRKDPDNRIDALRLSSSLVAFVQVIVQALFLLCSLRRYPSDMHHVERKPGRGAITTLIIGNAAVWIFRTVLSRGSDMKTQDRFYGEVPWLMLKDINMPLALFFCFHSSICFADVWHHAYAPLDSDSPLVSRSSSVSHFRAPPSVESSSCQKSENNSVGMATLGPIFSVSHSGLPSSVMTLPEGNSSGVETESIQTGHDHRRCLSERFDEA